MKSKIQDRPFKIGTPSLFFINSPFQALCMLEAISEFQIKEYKVYLVLFDDVRNAQLIKLLNDNKIAYTVIKDDNRDLIDYLTLLFSFRYNKYKRAFIGFYNNDRFFYYAIKKISCNSDIVYLDDGAATITLLKGLFKRTLLGNVVFSLFRIVSFAKRVSLDNAYTIYEGISNNDYNIKICGLNRLKELQNNKEKGGVLIVGTNSNRYCQAYSLSHDDYSGLLDKYFHEIQNQFPNEEIVYVPHGRDESKTPQALCNSFGFAYQKVDTTVEMYVVNSLIAPVAIYGFTSSALYNLKKILPSCSVYNILLAEDKKLREISGYYETIGIQTI